VSTIPVLGTTPAAFGQTAAGWMLCELAGAPFMTEPAVQPREEAVAAALAELREREEARWGASCPPLPVDLDDVRACVRVGPRQGLGAMGSEIATCLVLPVRNRHSACDVNHLLGSQVSYQAQASSH
jgi:hypothetical protein